MFSLCFQSFGLGKGERLSLTLLTECLSMELVWTPLYCMHRVDCPAFLPLCFLTVAATEEMLLLFFTITLLFAILFLTASKALATNYVTMFLKMFCCRISSTLFPTGIKQLSIQAKLSTTFF